MTTLAESKTLSAVKDWRETDKQKIGAALPEEKDRARKKHRHSEQKLRACADKLVAEEGNAP